MAPAVQGRKVSFAALEKDDSASEMEEDEDEDEVRKKGKGDGRVKQKGGDKEKEQRKEKGKGKGKGKMFRQLDTDSDIAMEENDDEDGDNGRSEGKGKRKGEEIEKERVRGKGKRKGEEKERGKGKGKGKGKELSGDESEEGPTAVKTKQRKPGVPTGELHNPPCSTCRDLKRECEKEMSGRACVSCKTKKHRCDYSVPVGLGKRKVRVESDEDEGRPRAKRAVKVGPPATPATSPSVSKGPVRSKPQEANQVEPPTASRPRKKTRKTVAALIPGMPPFL